MASVRVIGADVTFGLVSDIDDTVMITALPRPLIAAWNTFVRHEQARHIVPGMAPMYRDAAGRAPGRADLLPVHRGVEHRADADPVPQASRLPGRAAAAHRLGADQHRAGSAAARSTSAPRCTGWPRSSPRSAGSSSATTASTTRGSTATSPRDRPDLVEAIAIRELTPAEQVLSHGIPVSNEEFAPAGAPAGADLPRRRRLRTAPVAARRPGPLTLPLRRTWGSQRKGVPRCYSPVRPSSPSRSRSACPLCLAYSSTMWTSTQRSDTSSPHLAW